MTGSEMGRSPIHRDDLVRALRVAQDDVYEVNRANGWFDEDRTFGDDVALLHTEVSEMFDAYRDHGYTDATADPNDPLSKPEGVGSEAADIFIRLLDTCERRHIDLAFEFERKLAFNKTRGYKHGGKVI